MLLLLLLLLLLGRQCCWCTPLVACRVGCTSPVVGNSVVFSH
jgi:hypothetical protein